MKLVYTAGPVRNASLYERHKNIVRAEHIAVELWQMGYAVHCPHKNCEFIDGAIDDPTIIAGDLEIISRCDGVVVCPGWQGSSGTLTEIQFCKEHEIPIFYWEAMLDKARLEKWVKED